MARRAALLLIIVTTAPSACFLGPKWNVTGTFVRSARDSALIFTLQQSDDTIVGRACYSSGPYLVYRDVQVGGEFPRVDGLITAGKVHACCPAYIGARIIGAVRDRDYIVLHYQWADGRQTDTFLELTRAPAGYPGQCPQ